MKHKLLAVIFFFIFLFPVGQASSQEVYHEHEEEHEQHFNYIGELAIGESTSDLQKKLDENREEQEKIKRLLDETRTKKSTLQNEIIYQDNQIKLTELKIDETEKEIEKLTGQINQLEGVLLNLSDVFAERVVESYILNRTGSSLVTLITSDNVNEFIARFEYLQRIQQADRDLLIEMQSTQTNYEGQRQKVQELHDQLEAQKNKLAGQKAQKQNLLKVTQADEKKYQEMLAALKADEAAIERAVSSLIARIVAGIATGTQVSKGQVIGQEGNTGYVFPKPSSSCPECGYHLHFMILPCNVLEKSTSCHTDPSPYLSNGEYAKPMSMGGDWTSYKTQGYGYTSFSQSGAYSGAPHSGIDLQVKPFGAAVYSIADGVVYYGVDSAGGKYALVKHKDDFWSAYWHLQ